MNCPRCGSPIEAAPLTGVRVYFCSNTRCGQSFVDRQDILKVIPPEYAHIPGAVDLAVRTLIYEPYAKPFTYYFAPWSDERLARWDTELQLDLALTLMAQQLLPQFIPDEDFYELYEAVEEELGYELHSMFVDVLKNLLAIALGREIGQRISRAQTPAAKMLAEFINRDWKNITTKEAQELARLCQFTIRYNPDGRGSRKAQEEENNEIVWEALLEELRTNPPPINFTKDELLNLISGGLNHYPEHADNELNKYLQTLRRRTLRHQPIEDNLPYPVKLSNDPVDSILLAEIFNPQESQVVELTRRGYTQAEIAEMMSKSQPRISQIFRSALSKIGQHRSQA